MKRAVLENKKNGTERQTELITEELFKSIPGDHFACPWKNMCSQICKSAMMQREAKDYLYFSN